MTNRKVLLVLGAFSIALGTAVIATGVHLDFTDNDALSSRPFLTNVLTALGGALVGVPLALTVFQLIARKEAEHVQWKVTLKMVEVSFSEVAGIIEYATSSDPSGNLHYLKKIAAAEYCYYRCDQLIDELLSPLKNSSKEERGMALLGTLKPSGPLRREMLYSANELEHLAHECTAGLPTNEGLRTAAPHYLSRLEFMENHIRPRILEAGFTWVSPIVTMWIRRIFDTQVTQERWEVCVNKLATGLRELATKGKIEQLDEFVEAHRTMKELHEDFCTLRHAVSFIEEFRKYPHDLQKGSQKRHPTTR